MLTVDFLYFLALLCEFYEDLKRAIALLRLRGERGGVDWLVAGEEVVR